MGSLDIPKGSGSSTLSASSASSMHKSIGVDPDQDNDSGGSYDLLKNDSFLDFGPEAGTADKRGVGALLRNYYEAAVANDGARACSMMVKNLARTVPEDYGRVPGPAYMRGNTCPVVLSLLFRHFHRRLDTYLPTMKVAYLRLNGSHGLAVLGLAGMHERQILVAREGHVWKVGGLLDSEVP